MRIIAIANQKGGCGKTTTSINLAACLAHLHKKILLVDLDPQGHSTCGLGFHAEKLPYTLYDLMTATQQAKPEMAQVIQRVNDNLEVLPSYTLLGALEEELSSLGTRQTRLKEILHAYEETPERPDYVILDCPPNLGVLTYNALKAADEIIIPIEPSFFSLHGLAKISETINSVNQSRVFPLRIHALLTIFDSRTCFSKDVYDEVRTYFKEKLFRTIIHESVSLKEAASAGRSIVDFDSASPAFRDYLHLAVEFLERDWDQLLPEKKLGWRNVLKRRYGPRRVMGGVLFQCQTADARCVEIAGDFNNWVPEPLIRRDALGLWQKVLPITEGQYRYKLIVDGEWQIDPYHPEKRENAYGSYDSFLELV